MRNKRLIPAILLLLPSLLPAQVRLAVPAFPAPAVQGPAFSAPALGPAAGLPLPSLSIDAPLPAAGLAALPEAGALPSPEAAAPAAAAGPGARAPALTAADDAAPASPAAAKAGGEDVSAALKGEADLQWSRLVGGSERPLQVLMLGSESVPFVKTGGLADVLDALSRGLADRGHRVALILPLYPTVDPAKHGLSPLPGSFEVPLGARSERATLMHKRHGGVDVYFVANDNVYSRDGPYAPTAAGYDDTDDRFIFFSRAALEASRRLGFKPDVIHAHDWHTGIVPALVRRLPDPGGFFSGSRLVHTIHNIAYQGLFPPASLLKAGLDASEFTPERLEYFGRVNLLKAAIVFADAVTTVSPTYARETREGPEFGRGLEGALRARGEAYGGILNGLDPALWDPATDTHLFRNYGVGDSAQGKAANKAALQRETGLRPDPGAVMLGVASRIDAQKGLDLVAALGPRFADSGLQLVMVGSGDKALEASLKEVASRHPQSIFLHGFSEAFARKIYAASDLFLMPSRFEPCGLSQLIAQRYGSLPIVSPTGGLLDTVRDADEAADGGDGFRMREFSADALAEAVARALERRRDPAAWERTRRAAMVKDSSWSGPLDRYVELYRRLLSRKPAS